MAALASVVLLAAACIPNAFGPEPAFISAEYRNKSDEPLQVGLTWEGPNARSFQIPPGAGGRLYSFGGASATAYVYTLGCRLIGMVRLDPQLDTVSIEVNMHVAVISHVAVRSAFRLTTADPLDSMSGLACQSPSSE